MNVRVHGKWSQPLNIFINYGWITKEMWALKERRHMSNICLFLSLSRQLMLPGVEVRGG